MLMLVGAFRSLSSEIDTKPAAEVKRSLCRTKKSAKPSPLANRWSRCPHLVQLNQLNLLLTGYAIEGCCSTLEFIGAKSTTDHKGGFKVKGGATLGDDGSTFGESTIDMTSVYADDFRVCQVCIPSESGKISSSLTNIQHIV